MNACKPCQKFIHECRTDLRHFNQKKAILLTITAVILGCFMFLGVLTMSETLSTHPVGALFVIVGTFGCFYSFYLINKLIKERIKCNIDCISRTIQIITPFILLIIGSVALSAEVNPQFLGGLAIVFSGALFLKSTRYILHSRMQ